MNLDVIKFLVEHGADKGLRSKAPSFAEGLTAYELSAVHCASAQVKQILTVTKQVYKHPKLGKRGSTRREALTSASILLDDSKVKVGCCSMLQYCKPSPFQSVPKDK